MARVNEWLTLVCVLLGFAHIGQRVLNVKERLQRFADVDFGQISFQTGDLLLFQSNLALSFLLDSPYSHVGMVVCYGSGTFLWEITGSGGRPTLTPIDLELLRSAGTVYYRRLRTTFVDEDVVVKYIQAHANFTYDFSTWKHVLHETFQNALFPRLPAPTKPPQGASCANMIGHFLQEMGLFPDKEYFLPEDFSALSLGGAHWADDVRINF